MSVELKLPFRPAEHHGGGTLPEGEQVVTIVKSEKRVSNSGHDMLVFTCEGAHGAQGFEYVNLWHPNPLVREIAIGTLKAICEAAGIKEMRNTSELHGRKVTATVSHEESDDGFVFVRFLGWAPPPKQRPITEPNDDLPF